MNARLASDKTVEVRHGKKLCMLRVSDEEPCEIVCVVDSKSLASIWIGLRDGQIAIIKLPKSMPKTIDITPLFSTAITAPVGELHGILESDADGSAVLEAFGSDAWARLDTNGRVLRREVWKEPLCALSHVIALPEGRLRDAVAARGTPALLCIDVVGRVYVAPGASITDILQCIGDAPAAELEQAVANVTLAACGDIAIIVGQLHAVVILYTATAINMVRAVLPAEFASLSTADVRVEELDDGRVRVRNARARSALFVSVDKIGVPTFELQDAPASRGLKRASDGGSRAEGLDDSEVSKALTALLLGIERAGALHEAAEERGCRAERRLASFNSALLFALQAASSPSDQTGPNDAQKIECNFSSSMVPAPESVPFFTTPAWVGVNTFVNVHLKNRSSISLGSGWNLRLTIEHAASEPKREIESVDNTGDSSDDEIMVDIGSSRPIEKHAMFTRQLSVALPSLPASGEATVSFPIALESHAPLYVSLDMHFVVPARLASSDVPTPFSKASPRSRGFSLSLVQNEILDVLIFSASSSTPTPDVAHHRLHSARLESALSPDTAPARDPLPLSARLLLPLEPDALRASLSLTKQGAARCRSFLGADFSVDVAASPSGSLCGTLVTVRASPAVLPFVRAAVLRRAARFVTGVKAPSVDSAEQWERRLVDAADAALPALREAERALQELRGMKELVAAGRLDVCAHKEDVTVMRKAFSELEAATHKWRLGVRDAWEPDDNARL